MGFFSAISRILKATVVGALMLPRIDHSVMPDGFQRFDRGAVKPMLPKLKNSRNKLVHCLRNLFISLTL
jgi:hypothetical protein